MSAHARWATAEAEHLARFRSKFHTQRTEFEKSVGISSLSSSSISSSQQTQQPTIIGQISYTASKLLDLRDSYRRNISSSQHQQAARAALIEAKSLLSNLPKFVLEDDPKLASSLKIIRASASFGFDPVHDKNLADIIDLVKRSAYAVDASRAIQFLSVLQTFPPPRPVEDIRIMLENVTDGIRSGSSELMIHEVATLLSALQKLEKDNRSSSSSSFSPGNSSALLTSSSSSSSGKTSTTITTTTTRSTKQLLEALTRHLVTYHTTAPLNDVCRATAFLTKVTSAHGRVVLHEIQSRVVKEANNLTIPPVAALDLMSAYANLEPEDVNPIVKFPRNFELDEDVSAPPSLSLSSRPVAKRLMLSSVCETLITNTNMLSAEDVADTFMSLRQSKYHHEILLDRLTTRAMKLTEKTNLISMIRILEAVNYFQKDGNGNNSGGTIPKELSGPLFDAYANKIVRFQQHHNTAQGVLHLKSFTFHNCLSLLNCYAENGDDDQFSMFSFCLEQMSRMTRFSSSYNNNNNNDKRDTSRFPDEVLIKTLEVISQLQFYKKFDNNNQNENDESQQNNNNTNNIPISQLLRGNKAAIRVIGNVIHELFVIRGGLSSNQPHLVDKMEKLIEEMLPVAERDAELAKALEPLLVE